MLSSTAEIQPYDFRGQQPVTEAQAILLAVPDLLQGGRDFADTFSGSERGFNVGNGSLARDGDGKWFSIYSANYKALEKRTICAEKVAALGALKNNLEIVAFAVDAPLQPDKKTGLQFPTLHPCGACREDGYVLGGPSVVENPTVITRVSNTFSHQVLSGNDLSNIHAAPTQFYSRAADVIEDEEYIRLRSGALEMAEIFETGVPQTGYKMPTATVVNIAWKTS